MKKYVLLAVLMLALVVTAVSCDSKNDPVDTTDAAQTTVENTTDVATEDVTDVATEEATTEEATEATTEETTEATTEETTEATTEETTEGNTEEASVEETTEEATTEEVTTEEVTTEEVTEPEAPIVEKLVIDIANTTGVATDAAWIPNQHLLGPRVLADDTTGQINAINVFNSNFLGETGYGNVIVGGYVSVGEVDLSLYKSVTLLVAGGGAGQTNEAWMTDAEGNQLNAVNASFTAGNGSSEGTQTLRTITIDLDTDYSGEVRFLFTQANVVTVVGITFNP